jgi:hypothetical protein
MLRNLLLLLCVATGTSFFLSISPQCHTHARSRPGCSSLYFDSKVISRKTNHAHESSFSRFMNSEIHSLNNGIVDNDASVNLIDTSFAGSPCKIKVIGVGGGGGNAVNRMIASGEGVTGIDMWTVNTDSQALTRSLAPSKLNIGKTTSRFVSLCCLSFSLHLRAGCSSRFVSYNIINHIVVINFSPSSFLKSHWQ